MCKKNKGNLKVRIYLFLFLFNLILFAKDNNLVMCASRSNGHYAQKKERYIYFFLFSGEFDLLRDFTSSSSSICLLDTLLTNVH